MTCRADQAGTPQSEALQSQERLLTISTLTASATATIHGHTPLAGAAALEMARRLYPDASRIVNSWIWQAKDDMGIGGYIVRDGELIPIASSNQKAVFDDNMTQRSIDITMTDNR